jgi:hypothetical protein
MTTESSVAIVGEPGSAFDIIERVLRPYSVAAVHLPEKRLLYVLAELRAGETPAAPAPELYLFNVLGPFRYDWRQILSRLRHGQPNVAIVVLADTPTPETIGDAMRAGADEVLYEAELSFPHLVWQRIGGLIELARPEEAGPPALSDRLPTPPSQISRPPSAGVLGITASNLRAPSGRLDATKIAHRLGIPIARLAALVGVSRQALNQTRDSTGTQAALDPIARMFHALDSSLDPNDEPKWLRASHPGLEGKSPLDAVMSGEADVVARMLERAIR